MAVYMAEADVSGAAAYGSVMVNIPFMPKRITVILMDTGTDDAYVSLDGTNDHGHLVPNTPSAGLIFEQAIMAAAGFPVGSPGGATVAVVHLRRGAAGAAPTNVQVIAEA